VKKFDSPQWQGRSIPAPKRRCEKNSKQFFPLSRKETPAEECMVLLFRTPDIFIPA
jgi:hypothetical protein